MGIRNQSKYSDKFRETAIAAVVENHRSYRDVARDLGVEHNGYVAFVSYKPEYRDAIGGSYENYEFEYISKLVSVTVEVKAMCNADGDTKYPELAAEPWAHSRAWPTLLRVQAEARASIRYVITMLRPEASDHSEQRI